MAHTALNARWGTTQHQGQQPQHVPDARQTAWTANPLQSAINAY